MTKVKVSILIAAILLTVGCASVQTSGQIPRKQQAEAYTVRGAAYLGKDLYDQAIADFNQALALNPNYAEAYSNRGAAYLGKDLYDQAIADSNQALALNPNLAVAYTVRGAAYLGKGLYDQAWEDIYKAQSLGYQVPPQFLELLRRASGRQR